MKKKMIFVIIIIALICSKIIYVYCTHSSKVVTIKTIDHKVYKDGDDVQDKYLIFTEKDGVFENTDSWFYFKWNSSDVQNSFVVGGKFKISYYGWRIPFISSYPNIIKAEKVE